jgi:hypothetical protein
LLASMHLKSAFGVCCSRCEVLKCVRLPRKSAQLQLLSAIMVQLAWKLLLTMPMVSNRLGGE